MFDDLIHWIQTALSRDDADNICTTCQKVVSITPAKKRIALQDDIELQVETSPTGHYEIARIDLSKAPGVEIVKPYNSANGRITLKFVKRSLSSTDERIIVAEGGGGRAESRITVSLFELLWRNHPGTGVFPCDSSVFHNQCAIRMGVALETSDIPLPDSLRKCTNQYSGYASHRTGKISGHVLAAEQLAKWLDGSGTFPAHATASSKTQVEGRTGVIFFLDGWGPTDHIDVWDGKSLKGGDASYFNVKYKGLWFWEVY